MANKFKLSEKVKANVVEYLEPDEQIQTLFPALTKSPYLAGVLTWTVGFSKYGLKLKSTRPRYRVVVVTDRRILICDMGRWRRATVKGLLRELPRLTQIGPAKGLWYRTEALGERLYIDSGFGEEIALADSGPSIPGALGDQRR